MPVWNTSNSVLGDSSTDTARTKTHAMPVLVAGLLPNAKYSCRIDGLDYNWACQPFGGMMGDQIQADAEGKAKFTVYAEVPYVGQFAVDAASEAPQTAAGYESIKQDVHRYVTSNRVLELIGPGSSYAKAYFPIRTLIAPTH